MTTAPFVPLDGITILDLSRYLPGPFLTRILADLGAEVIKVEPPTGEGLRWMPPHAGGMNVSFASLNAGKRSLAVDLKRPEGQEVVRALLPHVDVLVEGFRPGVLDRLGLAWDTLLEAHPRLVGVSLTGFGQEGPLRERAGHDLNYLARAGVLGLFGPADAPPTVPGVQIADVTGGTYPAAIGVLAALMERDRTGRGRHLDVSLAHGAFGFATIAMAAAAAGHTEPRGAGVLTGGAPCCRCYPTADGRHVAFSALEPHFYDRFCELVGRDDLKGTAYAMGAEATPIVAALAEVFAAEPLAHWEALAATDDLCLEPVRTPAEAVADPSFAPWVKDAGGHPVVQLPLGVAADAVPAPAPPQPLGADGREVVTRYDLDPELVDAAVRAGALVLPDPPEPS